MNNSKKIVIKVGTKVIASKEKGLDKSLIKNLVYQISDICDSGSNVILVTSGAIGAGMNLLGMKKRPTELAELQASAAVGQNYLMQVYSGLFKERGYTVGQVLLTQEDFNDRRRYLNIKHTLNALLERKAIPIINENDTVATDEIRCGDNDRLSSLVADLLGADKLVLLTDVDGLLDSDGNVISIVPKITAKLLSLGGRSHCDLGTGGMATKLEAAKNVMSAGIECVIANGKTRGILADIMGGRPVGTKFSAQDVRVMAKKRWIAFSSKPIAALCIDDGAVRALKELDKSLLATGVVALSGNFASGDVVRITDRSGIEIARGVSNYSREDMLKIKGHKSGGFEGILGYKGPDEVVHKDNLVIL